MLRSSATRGLLRSLNQAAAAPASRATASPVVQQLRSQLCTAARRPALSAVKPLSPSTLALVRWNSKAAADKTEADLAKEKLEATPDLVSTTSSTHPIRSEIGQNAQEHDTDMMAGVRSDMQTIRDTFSLQDVPKEAYYVGMAGVIPYLATSLSTVYCAWEINHAHEVGTGLLMSEKTAEALLHVIEPLQVGYGAVIVSFLGAIHWGLEWAGFGGRQGYPRYAIGIISTAVAWPTILMPVEYALITQFLVFNFLYYADSRATKRGWTPQWYGVYRFVLTFIVGSAIVASLVGRGQIAHLIETPSGTADRIRHLRDVQDQEFEDEEEARRNFLASKDKEDDEE
ncbi:Hypothetical protein R9X50_00508200 [Acrodontium crateriforme]|uniref:Mitochondrial inner membrane protein 1 n=1 Tax=Acrodontium crateriforme TaxID=150365 RepID=A0AAQ3R5M5_9PEZI|nr:Hypothetical protein R9X50_00508200 [Acrodontium crateriforme]